MLPFSLLADHDAEYQSGLNYVKFGVITIGVGLTLTGIALLFLRPKKSATSSVPPLATRIVGLLCIAAGILIPYRLWPTS